jgi:hypothetical protein
MRFCKYSSDERTGVLRRPINQIHHGPTIRRERNIAPVVMKQIKGLELSQLRNTHRSDLSGRYRLKRGALRLRQRQKDFHTITRRCHLMSPANMFKFATYSDIGNGRTRGRQVATLSIVKSLEVTRN